MKLEQTMPSAAADTLAVRPTAARPDEAANALASGISLVRFVFILAQLGLLAVALRQFQVESAALLRIALLGFGGFAVHYFLPLRWRLPFFVALSLGGIAMIFGPADAAWLVFFGLVLIGICHLPMRLWARVALLLLVGGVFALMRLEIIHGPWSRAVWPILGAMFMFRLIVYIYDMQHEQVPPSASRSLAYFFLLPNVCFPMFPVVDYRSFRRGYYDVERHRLYQIGVDWMTRGVVHLLLYRIVNYHFTVAPSEVVDPDTLVQHVVANFMLYLRISGTFHLITGMLHLFGFNLLETHKRYCVSSSFTDFWRRINIYCKDFMMKLFYYPLYFRLKKYGATTALVVATLLVFICTWLLHSYQWFWLRGEFPIAWQDGAFWLILAVLVVGNSIRELKKGRARSLSKDSWSFAASSLEGLRAVGIFFLICVLWSIWTCESLSSWVSMWDFLWRGVGEGGHYFPKVLLLVAAVIFGASLILSRLDRVPPVAANDPGKPFARSTLWTVAMLIVMAAAGMPQIYLHLGTSTANAIGMLRSGNLGRADAAMLERGYYEDLTRVNRFNSELWQLYMAKPMFHWLDVLHGGGLGHFTGDFLQQDLMPGFKADTPYGTIRTNQWGMRDKDYDKLPPPGTYRIAMLGASTVMGWGVEQDQTFEHLLEDRLNAKYDGNNLKSVEILNMGVPGYYPLQEAPMNTRAMEFKPNAVYYIATGREFTRSITYITEVMQKKIKIPYPALDEIVKGAGVDYDTSPTAIVKRLNPHKREILTWLYQTIAAECRRGGAMPVWVFVPQIYSGAWTEETAPAEQLAVAAGFEIVNLDEVFKDSPVETIRVAEWDDHPNALGHRLLADLLFQKI